MKRRQVLQAILGRTINGKRNRIAIMDHTFVVTAVEAVEAVESDKIEVRLALHDSSTLTLIMDGPTLSILADQSSQYATS
jgi:hypothetical protein